MTTTRPAIFDSTDHLSARSTPASVTIAAAQIREGMVLLDPESGTPLYWIDNKVRGSHGSVQFNVWNLKTNHFETGFRISATTNVPAMAR